MRCHAEIPDPVFRGPACCAREGVGSPSPSFLMVPILSSSFPSVLVGNPASSVFKAIMTLGPRVREDDEIDRPEYRLRSAHSPACIEERRLLRPCRGWIPQPLSRASPAPTFLPPSRNARMGRNTLLPHSSINKPLLFLKKESFGPRQQTTLPRPPEKHRYVRLRETQQPRSHPHPCVKKPRNGILSGPFPLAGGLQNQL